jgi:hypothetical protein
MSEALLGIRRGTVMTIDVMTNLVLKEQPNLAAAFGVREACFRFSMQPRKFASDHTNHRISPVQK